MGITISNVIEVIAIMLSPLIALRVETWLRETAERRQRKLWIFKTLMGTRARRLDHIHVQALNMIDLEFNEKVRKEKLVVVAWKAYLDILGDTVMPLPSRSVKQEELFVDLMYEMAKVLSYPFTKTDIKNTSYYPVGHGQQDEQQKIVSKGLADIFAGRARFPVSFDPAMFQEQDPTQDLASSR